jgi:hypothetical protein
MRKRRHPYTIALPAAALFWAALVYNDHAPQDEDAAILQNHCQMVELWQQTSGQFGWPDYNNSAHACADGDDESPDNSEG